MPEAKSVNQVYSIRPHMARGLMGSVGEVQQGADRLNLGEVALFEVARVGNDLAELANEAGYVVCSEELRRSQRLKELPAGRVRQPSTAQQLVELLVAPFANRVVELFGQFVEEHLHSLLVITGPAAHSLHRVVVILPAELIAPGGDHGCRPAASIGCRQLCLQLPNLTLWRRLLRVVQRPAVDGVGVDAADVASDVPTITRHFEQARVVVERLAILQHLTQLVLDALAMRAIAALLGLGIEAGLRLGVARQVTYLILAVEQGNSFHEFMNS